MTKNKLNKKENQTNFIEIFKLLYNVMQCPGIKYICPATPIYERYNYYYYIISLLIIYKLLSFVFKCYN